MKLEYKSQFPQIPFPLERISIQNEILNSLWSSGNGISKQFFLHQSKFCKKHSHTVRKLPGLFPKIMINKQESPRDFIFHIQLADSGMSVFHLLNGNMELYLVFLDGGVDMSHCLCKSSLGKEYSFFSIWVLEYSLVARIPFGAFKFWIWLEQFSCSFSCSDQFKVSINIIFVIYHSKVLCRLFHVYVLNLKVNFRILRIFWSFFMSSFSFEFTFTFSTSFVVLTCSYS